MYLFWRSQTHNSFNCKGLARIAMSLSVVICRSLSMKEGGLDRVLVLCGRGIFGCQKILPQAPHRAWPFAVATNPNIVQTPCHRRGEIPRKTRPHGISRPGRQLWPGNILVRETVRFGEWGNRCRGLPILDGFDRSGRFGTRPVGLKRKAGATMFADRAAPYGQGAGVAVPGFLRPHFLRFRCLQYRARRRRASPPRAKSDSVAGSGVGVRR
jgi:hypothetical protein